VDAEYGIIYCIENTINGHKYIGQTTRKLEKRISEHFKGAESGRNSSRVIYKAINKYGKENFISYVIDKATNQESLDEKESYWINHFDTFLSNGYNMTPGGQFDRNDNLDETTANESSKIHKGKEFCVFDINGNLLKTTISQTAFAEEIGCTVKSVNACLKGKKTQVKKHILIFTKDYTDTVLLQRMNRAKKYSKTKPDMRVIDVKTGCEMGIWNCLKKCSEDLDISVRTIQNQLSGKVKTPKMYVFAFVGDIEDEVA